MEYKNIINLLDTTPNQLSKFRTKILVQINDDPYGMHNTDSQIKFKISMLKSSLSNYSEAIHLLKELSQLENVGLQNITGTSFSNVPQDVI